MTQSASQILRSTKWRNDVNRSVTLDTAAARLIKSTISTVPLLQYSRILATEPIVSKMQHINKWQAVEHFQTTEQK